MGDADATPTLAVEARGYRRGALSTDSWDQYVVPVLDRIASSTCRANTFSSPGRAAQGQKILALHNAASSPVDVNVNRIRVDAITTAAKLITALPPVIRVQRFTALPTGGTQLAKVQLETGAPSNAAVTAWGDASADGTISGTTLTISAGGILGQAYGPRYVSTAILDAGARYEAVDTVTFFEGEPDVTLNALEGVVLFLDMASTVAPTPGIGNLATDQWLATVDWEEYTRV